MRAGRAVLAALRLPEPRTGPALAEDVQCRARGRQPLEAGDGRGACERVRRQVDAQRGCCHGRGGRGGRGEGRRGHRAAEGVGLGDDGSCDGRGLPHGLRLPGSSQHRLLIFLHCTDCPLDVHLLFLGNVLLQHGDLHLPSLPDFPLRAKMTMAALRTVLATLRFVEPCARPALPRAVQHGARGLRRRPVDDDDGRRRGPRWRRGEAGRRAQVERVLFARAALATCRLLFLWRGTLELLLATLDGVNFVFLPRLDLPLRAKVAMPALGAVLAATRLVQPSTGPALACAMEL
mmetsp:Transcript_43083/g.109500  ORF Transcript_43083/g.109500 Transcript_43083/m.109500 type:complete len:291 (+) Transcript_43083:730-1602(+)